MPSLPGSTRPPVQSLMSRPACHTLALLGLGSRGRKWHHKVNGRSGTRRDRLAARPHGRSQRRWTGATELSCTETDSLPLAWASPGHQRRTGGLDHLGPLCALAETPSEDPTSMRWLAHVGVTLWPGVDPQTPSPGRPLHLIESPEPTPTGSPLQQIKILTGSMSMVPGGPGNPSAPGRPGRPGGPCGQTAQDS